MKFLNFNRVLCLSPHPDDVEYGMAGTILKYDETRFDILCLTCGGDFDATTGNPRLEEMKKFWEKSGCRNAFLYFTQHKMLKELGTDAWVNYIETVFVINTNTMPSLFRLIWTVILNTELYLHSHLR